MIRMIELFAGIGSQTQALKNAGIEAEYALVSAKGFGYNISASYGNPKTQKVDAYNYDFGVTMAACLGVTLPDANGIVLDIFER